MADEIEDLVPVRDLSQFPVVPIRVRCKCAHPRTLPVWWISDVLTLLRTALAGRLQADDEVMTHRCRSCKVIVSLTARDLHLV